MKEIVKGRNKEAWRRQREKAGVEKRKHMIIPRDHFSIHSPEKQNSPFFSPSTRPTPSLQKNPLLPDFITHPRD